MLPWKSWIFQTGANLLKKKKPFLDPQEFYIKIKTKKKRKNPTTNDDTYKGGGVEIDN